MIPRKCRLETDDALPAAQPRNSRHRPRCRSPRRRRLVADPPEADSGCARRGRPRHGRSDAVEHPRRRGRGLPAHEAVADHRRAHRLSRGRGRRPRRKRPGADAPVERGSGCAARGEPGATGDGDQARPGSLHAGGQRRARSGAPDRAVPAEIHFASREEQRRTEALARRAVCETARADVRTAEAQIDATAVDRQRTVLVAPFAGTVAKITANSASIRRRRRRGADPAGDRPESTTAACT